MTTMALGQLVRNAVAVEEAAAAFYRRLLEASDQPETRRFLGDLAAQEDGHAEQVREFGARLVDGALPVRPDFPVSGVETAPSWGNAPSVTLEQALSVAYEAEYHAHLFYDSLADRLDGKARDFFRVLAATELEHVRALERFRPGARA